MSMEEFHQIFFEEADELIAAMEAELLEMVFEPDDPERINTVFRAAHSIKGGAATFGFVEIADVTHVMETLMDEVRDGSLSVTRPMVDALLGAVDCFKDLLAAARRHQPADPAQVSETRVALEAWLPGGGQRDGGAEEAAAGSGASGSGSTADAPEPSRGAGARSYEIRFRPASARLGSGNDPIHVFRVLRELGDLAVELEADSVPALDGFEVDRLYLGWNLRLVTTEETDVVMEALEWIDDVCDIEFEQPEIVAAVPAAAAGSGGQEAAPAAAVSAAAAAQGGSDPVVAGDRRGGGEAATIRVSVDRIDALINLAGELVITQSMLGDLSGRADDLDPAQLRDGLAQLERHTRELQEQVMKIRMVPISNVFHRLPRTVHDLSAKLGKKLELVMHGEHTELDKTLMERLGDPLVHLVRNAIDHGVEPPAQRLSAGKPESGLLELRAYHANGDVVIEVSDDGAGLDGARILRKARDRGLVSDAAALSEQQIHELVFQPGFSTVDQVSDVSGRGVGMDVVRQNILELGGTVEICSAAGQGTRFTIRLPLTLAIVDGQLLEVADQIYVAPLMSIIESVQVQRARLSAIAGRGQVYQFREAYVPVVDLGRLFGLRPDESATGRLLLLVESSAGRMGLLVDELLAQQQVVVKTLEANYRPVPGVSGATILGDGRVALILDIPGIARLMREQSGGPVPGGALPGIRAA